MATATAAAVLVFAAVPAPLAAQPDARQALVSVRVVPETVTVGERFAVEVRVRAPKVATIRFPDLPPAAEALEPVDPRSLRDGPPGEALDRTAIYTFAAWTPGPVAIPVGAVEVIVAGRSRIVSLATPTVVVRQLVPEDTLLAVPQALRGPVPLRGRWWQYAVLAGGLVVGALAYGWQRRRWRTPASPPPPDPWIRARDGFNALDALDLLGAGEPGRHVIAHVDVLRDYLTRRFPAFPAVPAGPGFAEALRDADVPVPTVRAAALFDEDARLRYAHADIAADAAAALATEARDLAAQAQLAHEARVRATERPPRPRRR